MEEKTVFIYNTSEKNLLSYLQNLFEKSIIVNCAIAFLSLEGWYSLKPIIIKWIERSDTKNIKIIVREDNIFPDKTAIKEIKQLKKIQLGIYKSTDFHIKQWIFNTTDKAYILTGSSNFTKKGLTENIEANTINELELNSKQLQEINNIFEQYWIKSIKVSDQGINMALHNLSFKITNITLNGLSWIQQHFNENSDVYDYRMSDIFLNKGNKVENILCREITVTFYKVDENSFKLLNEFKEAFDI